MKTIASALIIFVLCFGPANKSYAGANALEAEFKMTEKLKLKSTSIQSENIWEVNPNGKQKIIMVSNPSQERTYIKLVDSFGNLINVQTSRNGKIEIYIPSIKSGTYVLSLKSSSADETYELVVEK